MNFNKEVLREGVDFIKHCLTKPQAYDDDILMHDVKGEGSWIDVKGC